MKSGPGAVTPATVTVTMPFIGILGTAAMIWLSLQLLTGAFRPSTATVLLDCVGPKLVPPMVMTVVGSPVVGDRLVMTGGGVTAKGSELLTIPLLLTMTGPLVVPEDTITWIWVSLQHIYQGFCRHVFETLAVTPLIETTPF